MKRLHIYPQGYNHDHAFIVGDRESLTALGRAIVSALAEPNGCGETTCFAADGERYEVKVYKKDDKKYWDNSLLPYTDNMHLNNEGTISPWDLFKKHKK